MDKRKITFKRKRNEAEIVGQNWARTYKKWCRIVRKRRGNYYACFGEGPYSEEAEEKAKQKFMELKAYIDSCNEFITNNIKELISND